MADELIIPEVLKGKNLTKTIRNVNKKDLAKYMSQDAINEKLDKITNQKDKFFCNFLWMSGVRISEAINVRKRDINFQELAKITNKLIRNEDMTKEELLDFARRFVIRPVKDFEEIKAGQDYIIVDQDRDYVYLSDIYTDLYKALTYEQAEECLPTN